MPRRKLALPERLTVKNLDIKAELAKLAPKKRESLKTFTPVKYIEANFGVRLYSNQIKDVRSLFNPEHVDFATIAARGVGKTMGVSLGLLTYGMIYPGLIVIMAGPISNQAGRLLREMYIYLNDPKCKIGDSVDWTRSNKTNLYFNTGSRFVAFSGQVEANIEGEHGHILVVDEAHKVPSYTITNKLMPMVKSKEFSLTVMIGLASHNNFFRKFCQTPGSKVNKCSWDKSELFIDNKPTFLYRGRHWSKELLKMMPLPYKQRWFPDRPDLWKITASEVPTDDWETQYELIWSDHIANFLGEEDLNLLGGGKHPILTQAIKGESYYGGLDTAQGSITGNKDTDRIVLAIWRAYRTKAGLVKERVASYVWQHVGVIELQSEILGIIHPTKGIFPCRYTIVDYSNIGIDLVQRFQDIGVPIIGKHFGSSEKRAPKKNFKNAAFYHFLVELQSGLVKYPDIDGMRASAAVEKNPEIKIQIENMLEGFFEWEILERIKGRGNNDTIQAPTEKVDGPNGKTSEQVTGHDDSVSADILAIWAADYSADVALDLEKHASPYEIPMPSVGAHSSSSGVFQPGSGANTLQSMLIGNSKAGPSSERSGYTDDTIGQDSWLGDYTRGMNNNKK
jgi:hypothetical protein